jgi:hypothetical protein
MRARPIVDLHVQAPAPEVLGRFRACLDTGACTCEGSVGIREMSLVLRGEERHVFSPWLSVQAYNWEGGTRLRGRFGPHPNLWAIFVFIYAVFVFVFIGGLVYGYVQWVIGEPPTGLLVSLGGALAQGVACSIDLYGRSHGARQMHRVREFLLSTLPEARELPPETPGPHEVEA